MNKRRYFVDGAEVPREQFVVHGEDDGFLRGLSVFETMRTYNGRLFRPRRHLERLRSSAHALGIEAPALEVVLGEVTRSLDGFPPEAKVQVTLTVGGRRLMHVTPFDLGIPGTTQRVVSLPWEPPDWLDGRVKHCSRAAGQVARRLAEVDDVLWIGRDGCFTEAARSNIFAVVDGRIVTPPDDGRILCGVTRGALLEAGRDAGLPIEEVPLRQDAHLTELYLTSTLRELAPVTEVDGAPAPGGGPLGEALVRHFQDLVRRECGG